MQPKFGFGPTNPGERKESNLLTKLKNQCMDRIKNQRRSLLREHRRKTMEEFRDTKQRR